MEEKKIIKERLFLFYYLRSGVERKSLDGNLAKHNWDSSEKAEKKKLLYKRLLMK